MKNNQNIIIFGSTTEIAQEQLDKIISTINPDDIKQIIKSQNRYTCELLDGTYYQALYAGYGASGHRCTQAYVDIRISIEILHNIILPILCVSNLPREEQVIYY